MGVYSLYVHVPFCRARCSYCDFFSCSLGGDSFAPLGVYLDVARARIDELGDVGALDHVRTAYIGGGTPSMLGPALAGLVASIRRRCDPEELTCEANPESCTSELCGAIARAGATRVSIGVQSLADDELAAIGRVHTRAEALAAVARVRAWGMSVSCDLMCGLPGQTVDSWRRTLDEAIRAEPDHVSVYPLALEPGTPLALRCERGEDAAPDEDLQAALMIEARSALSGAGLEPYEVASYARGGHACRHNIAYWTGRSYAGVGPSAAGMLSVPELDRFRLAFPGVETGSGTARVRLRQRDARGRSFETECLSEREALAEDLMLGMRMSAGLGVDLLARARGVLGDAKLDAAIGAAIRDGFAAWAPIGERARLVPTERGWLHGNRLYGLLWDLARSA